MIFAFIQAQLSELLFAIIVAFINPQPASAQFLVDQHVSCAIVGDSIAVGLAPHLGFCYVDAKVGIPSAQVIARMDPDVMVTVVSAGSNDPDNPKLKDNLRLIRARTKNPVLWILPVHPRARAIVREVAAEFKDPTVSFKPSRDNVHPASYGALAQTIRDRGAAWLAKQK